ncbi:MAG: hypothetical protein P1U63_12280 [Coxiellaceae bacterium]|nr:hypothetical protein [Coxiellaceae bacterium]
MFKGKLLLGITLGLTVASAVVMAGGEDGDADGYDSMGYYVYSTDDPNQMQQNDFNSMYVGLQAGANIAQAGFSYNDTDGNATTDILSSKSGETYAIAGGIIGWGHAWDEFYLGVEGNGRYNFGGGSNNVFTLGNSAGTNTGTIDEVYETWSAGLGFKLGGIVYNTALIYFYGGGAYAGFKVNNAFYNLASDLGSLTQSKFGYSMGVGVDVQMNKAFNIDLRYLYRRFSNITWSAQGEGILAGTTLNSKVTPTDNLVMLAGEYHFAV